MYCINILSSPRIPQVTQDIQDTQAPKGFLKLPQDTQDPNRSPMIPWDAYIFHNIFGYHFYYYYITMMQILIT